MPCEARIRVTVVRVPQWRLNGASVAMSYDPPMLNSDPNDRDCCTN